MKKTISLVLMIIFSYALTSCSVKYEINPIKIGKESNYEINNDLIDISVVEKSITNSKATFVLVNNTNETYIYGEPYFIEYKKEDIWYELTPINKMEFNLIAYILKPNDKSEITVSWKQHYGLLPQGKYRVVKNVFRDFDRPIDQNDYVYIAEEFIIK